MRKKKLEKKSEKVLRLNRFLARKDVLAGICILEDVSLFFIVQYLLNICLNLPLWFETQNPKVCFGLKNLFPVPERVESFWGFYLVLVGVMVVWNAMTIYQYRTSYSEKNFNVNQKGSARWTTNEEIKEQYRGIPDRDETFSGAGGTIISRIGKTLYIDDTLTNNLIIGITRSGKGEMFVIPSIDVYSRAEEKTSMVITDPKMELYKTSKKTLEERGYLVYLLNLDDPLHSMGFNPLEQIKEEYLKKNYAEAELLAQAFSFSIFNPDSATNQDSFWQETAASLLTALILAHIQDCVKEDELTNERRFEAWQKKRAAYKKLTPKEQEEAKAMCERRKQLGDILLDPRVSAIPLEEEFVYTKENEKKITMYSIINTFTELARQKDEERPDLSALDSYFAERPMMDRAKMKYAGTELAGDRTKGSIYASMFVKLAIFTFENIAKMTAESSLKLEEVGFGEKPIAVFLGIPDYDSSPHFLATAFIRQLTFVLEKKATRYKIGKCKRKVRFILDEFGNLPAIQGMDKFITVCLGRNIAYDLYIQAYSQVEQLYDKAMDTIVGNCGNQIYILANDDRTAEKFSKDLGNETIIDIQRSGERLSSSKSVMESPTEKPLLNMNELKELREGECVVERVMKRKDLKGHRIRPTPIFNSESSGKRFLYRYEYLTDTFPNPGEIELTEVNTEDRSWIDHRERVWNFKRSFVQMQMEKANANKVLKLKELYNMDTILSLLEKVLTTEELMKVDPELPVMKLLDHSYIRLEEKVKNILAKLESNGFRAAIFLNESKTEWESMYRPYKEQQSEDLFFIYGQPLTSNALAAGNPFHFSSLQDPCGDFLGKTPCGGNVLFDEFHKSKTRRFYNSLAVGTMGSGKSTLLKKRFLTNAIKGNYVRTFDISGEFTTLTKTLGGKVLKLDGTNGILNPLEVLKAEEGEEISFTRHISKVSTIYKFLTEGSADTEEVIEFEELLRELYKTFGMELVGGKVKSQVTGLPANRYPTFSDLLAYIEGKMEEIQRKSKAYEAVELDLVKHRMAIMDKIRRVLSNITNTYGSLFDGHTSIDNILDEQIVTFDLSTIKEMKPSVFDAQIFNMISLCWDNCVTNGKLMMERLRKAKGEEGALDPEQVTKFLMIIDESHRWINTKKRHALESISIYLREARKFFGGIMLASQSIRDYVPEGSGAEEIDDLKKIFELTQYKFIFHQEADTLPLLDKVFENTLTQSQRNKIPKLEIGENILCIASDRNLEFKVHLTKEEDRIFEGGV